jgi:hypothetical protein
LVLRPDVVQAVREGKFHVYAVSTVDEGIALLTGVSAREPDAEGNYPEGTVNYRVHRRILEMAEEKSERERKRKTAGWAEMPRMGQMRNMRPSDGGADPDVHTCTGGVAKRTECDRKIC